MNHRGTSHTRGGGREIHPPPGNGWHPEIRPLRHGCTPLTGLFSGGDGAEVQWRAALGVFEGAADLLGYRGGLGP